MLQALLFYGKIKCKSHRMAIRKKRIMDGSEGVLLMGRGLHVAVVGATGAVGQQMLKH